MPERCRPRVVAARELSPPAGDFSPHAGRWNVSPRGREFEATTAYCLLRSLVKHSCINPKSLTFGYLDEKPIDTSLMKFLGLCPTALSWYLEFALHSPPPWPLLRPMLSLHESKGLMTPRKSHLYGTMVLPSP
ncbi:hypothetical protein GW17_00032512 [Ensete ventricosum]|nr:hypothetical protein GW17_00032512 [Ensete ventricosum]